MVDAALARGTGLLPRKILFKKGRRENDVPLHQISTSNFKILNAGDEEFTPRDRTGSADGAPAFSLSDEEEIKELMYWKRVSRIGAGLDNLGNTCFMNALLQCLTHTPPLANYAQNRSHSKSCQIKNTFCLFCLLETHIVRALSSSGSFSPKNIVANLKNISKNFRFGRQEDSHEFLRYVIEGLQNSSLRGINLKLHPKIAETTVPSRIFGGQLLSRVKCSQCNFTSDTVDPFLDLSLEIKACNSLERVFQRFTAPEILDKDNKYKCPKCSKLVRATKQFTIKKAPNILTIQLKRFSFHSIFGGKLDNMITFPEELDLKPFITSGEVQPSKYHLYGVLVHFGHTSHSGHYLSYVKSSAGIWYCMDDSRVQQVSVATVLKQKAYMLFYVRELPKNKRRREEETPERKAETTQPTPEKTAPKKSETLELPIFQDIKKRKVEEEQANKKKKKEEEQRTPLKANGKPSPTPSVATTPPQTPSPVTPLKASSVASVSNTPPKVISLKSITPSSKTSGVTEPNLPPPSKSPTPPSKSPTPPSLKSSTPPSLKSSTPPSLKLPSPSPKPTTAERNPPVSKDTTMNDWQKTESTNAPTTAIKLDKDNKTATTPVRSLASNSTTKQHGHRVVQMLSMHQSSQYSTDVPSWDSVDNETKVSRDQVISKISALEQKRKELDEWDKMYDQGRVKKVKKKNLEKGKSLGNLFQKRQNLAIKHGHNKYLFNNERRKQKIRRIRQRKHF